MKILVFGSTGALGTALEEVCDERDVEYIGMSHSDVDIIHSRAVEEIIDKVSPDAIINAVAVISPRNCLKSIRYSTEVNSMFPNFLASLCNALDITLVQPSTHSVFDGCKYLPYTENDIPNPINIYGAQKLIAESAVRHNCKKHYITRFPTMFGPRRNKSLGFVDKMIQRIRNGEDLMVAVDKIDSLSYTMDVADRLIDLLENEYPYGIYHVANSGVTSYYEFVDELRRLMNSDVVVKRALDSDFPSPEPNPIYTALESVKLDSIRGWEDALEEYVVEYL